jgi:hypothetical protein
MLLPYLLLASVFLIATATAPRFAQIYGSLFFAAFVLYLAVALDLKRRRFGSYAGLAKRWKA